MVGLPAAAGIMPPSRTRTRGDHDAGSLRPRCQGPLSRAEEGPDEGYHRRGDEAFQCPCRCGCGFDYRNRVHIQVQGWRAIQRALSVRLSEALPLTWGASQDLVAGVDDQ